MGGNSKTTLVINCSPSSYNDTETLSTLRFGMRAKKIENKAQINQELSAAELRKLLDIARKQIQGMQKAIAALEKEVSIWRSGNILFLFLFLLLSFPATPCLQRRDCL